MYARKKIVGLLLAQLPIVLILRKIFIESEVRITEVREALKRMKGGKAMGPDCIPIEVWRGLETRQ